MSLLKSKKLGFSALTLVVLALAAAQGCSSSDDSGQATPTAGTSSGGASASAGTSSTAGKGGSGTAGTGTGGSSAAGTGAGGSAGSTTMGEAGEGGAADCSGPDGCYNCAPTNDTQFLNHCVAGGCQPAQNFNLPATLPPLP
ncbi:MAG TPA: hypothetical protein VK745_08315 [Polyangiaceae bacterium]|nr:hypothetical protein [Polyangiaceae bacterium]